MRWSKGRADRAAESRRGRTRQFRVEGLEERIALSYVETHGHVILLTETVNVYLPQLDFGLDPVEVGAGAAGVEVNAEVDA